MTCYYGFHMAHPEVLAQTNWQLKQVRRRNESTAIIRSSIHSTKPGQMRRLLFCVSTCAWLGCRGRSCWCFQRVINVSVTESEVRSYVGQNAFDLQYTTVPSYSNSLDLLTFDMVSTASEVNRTETFLVNQTVLREIFNFTTNATANETVVVQVEQSRVVTDTVVETSVATSSSTVATFGPKVREYRKQRWEALTQACNEVNDVQFGCIWGARRLDSCEGGMVVR